MSHTQKALNNLPSYAKRHVDGLKIEYRNACIKPSIMANNKYIIRRGAIEYLTALWHAGMITETEKRLIITYITL